MVHKSEKLAEEWLNEKGFEVLVKKGAPDFLCRDKNGKLCFVEVKKNNDFIKQHQREWIYVIEKAGIKTHIVNVQGRRLHSKSEIIPLPMEITLLSVKKKIQMEDELIADAKETI